MHIKISVDKVDLEDDGWLRKTTGPRVLPTKPHNKSHPKNSRFKDDSKTPRTPLSAVQDVIRG